MAALQTLALAGTDVLAGIGWEPHIRGLLTVALGLAVLGGSVWLLLVTNTGTRLGSLIALAGFWGWMFVMGIFWWIYGIGWVGSLPVWEVEDVFIDAPGDEDAGIGDAFVGNVDQLPDANCNADTPGADAFPPAGGVASVRLVESEDCTPKAIEVLMAYDGIEREQILRERLNPQTDAGKLNRIANDLFGMSMSDEMAAPEVLESLSSSQRDQVFDRLIEIRHAEIRERVINNNELLGSDDPRFAEGAALEELIQENIDALNLRMDNLTLTDLKGNSPAILAWAEDQGFMDLGGWNLQSGSESGEAAATADAFLREELFPEGNFVVLDAYQQGGKPPREGDGMWDRVVYKITDAARIKNPTNYTVINVQQTIDKVADPAKPPPIAEADPAEPIYSVVMIRDLGNLRVIPAIFTIVSLLLFLLNCLVLHWRDLGLREKGLEV